MATTTQPLVTTATSPTTLRRSVLLLALPAVGEQVLNTLVGLADTFLVGNLSAQAATRLGYSSATALAGVGLANQMVWLVTVLFMAVSVGSTALIARSRGAADMQAANRALRQSMIVGLAMGVAATLLGTLFAAPFMQILGAGPDVLPRSVTFLHIAALTFAPAALLFIGTAALRGAGDTRTPLYVMLGVNAVNILISWLLVNGNLGAPTLGVTGSAIGAAVARGGGGLVLIGVLLRGRSGLKLSLDLRPEWDVLRRIVRIGLPSGGEQLVFQGALLIFVRFITGLGTVAYYEALLQGGLMMTVLGVIMVLFPHQLIGLFAADPSVAEAGAAPMRIAGLFQPLLALNFVMSGGLRGAGDTRWPLYTKIISTWGVRLPLVLLLLHLGLGLTGAWIAMSSDFLVQGILALWRFHKGAWKTMRV